METDLGSKTSKQVFKASKVQNGDCGSFNPFTGEKGLVFGPQATRYLQPYNNTPFTQEVSTMHCRPKSFPILSASLQSLLIPRLFSKVLVAVTAYLQQEVIMIFPYHDKWLSKNLFYEAVLSSTPMAPCSLFQEFGLQLNVMKSTLTPVKKIYRGLLWSHVQSDPVLPQKGS